MTFVCAVLQVFTYANLTVAADSAAYAPDKPSKTVLLASEADLLIKGMPRAVSGVKTVLSHIYI